MFSKHPVGSISNQEAIISLAHHWHFSKFSFLGSGLHAIFGFLIVPRNDTHCAKYSKMVQKLNSIFFINFMEVLDQCASYLRCNFWISFVFFGQCARRRKEMQLSTKGQYDWFCSFECCHYITSIAASFTIL